MRAFARGEGFSCPEARERFFARRLGTGSLSPQQWENIRSKSTRWPSEAAMMADHVKTKDGKDAVAVGRVVETMIRKLERQDVKDPKAGRGNSGRNAVSYGTRNAVSYGVEYEAAVALVGALVEQPEFTYSSYEANSNSCVRGETGVATVFRRKTETAIASLAAPLLWCDGTEAWADIGSRLTSFRDTGGLPVSSHAIYKT
jgi:hypothetical protein